MRLLRYVMECRYVPPFKYFDSRGALAEKLHKTHEYNEINIGPVETRFVFKSDLERIELFLAPDRMFCTLEGLSLSLGSHDGILKACDEVLVSLNIEHFIRIGVRFFLYSEQVAFDALKDRLSKDVGYLRTSKIVGRQLTDLAFVFEYAEDDYHMRLQAGPFDADNARDAKSHKGELFFKDIKTCLHLDCDVSQENVKKSGFKTSKQIELSFSRINKVIDEIEKHYVTNP